MKILITGGIGFIGCNTALKAMEQGHEVYAFDNLSRTGVEFNLAELSKHKLFHLIRGDVRDVSDLDRIPEVDSIIHLAANPGIPWSIKWPRYDFEVNTLGTLNVLEFARERGKLPTIYASSNKVFSEAVNEIPMKEESIRYRWISEEYKNGIPESFPVDSQGRYPHSCYGISKFTADLYAQEYYHIYRVPTVVNRQSCIAGKWQQGCQDQGWVAWFCFVKMFNATLNIFGNGKQVRELLNVEDFADLYLVQLQSIDTHKGKVYNVGGGPKFSRSLREVMDYLVQLEGNPFKIVYQNWRPADHKIYISDISKISKYWKPKISPEETVKQIWDWAVKHRSEIWKIFKESLKK